MDIVEKSKVLTSDVCDLSGAGMLLNVVGLQNGVRNLLAAVSLR